MATLPPEITSMVITCLLEPDRAAEQRWSKGEGVNPLNQVGAALCLTPRGFLPLGRRILYERIETRDDGWQGHMRCLRANAHLAVFVRKCTLSLVHDLDDDDISELLDLITSCPNVDAFVLRGDPYFEDADVDQDEFDDRFDRIEDIRSRVIADLPSSFRHLTLHSSIVAWEETIRLLTQSTLLKSLNIQAAMFSDEDFAEPPSLRFDLPSLVDLAVTTAPHELVKALLAGAPNLLKFTWSSKFDSFPTLRAQHQCLVSLSIEGILPATASSDPDAYLLSLSSFISSFTSLRNLSLLVIADKDDLGEPFTPSPLASTTFLSALPRSLLSLSLFGLPLLSTSLSITPLLHTPSHSFPNLRVYTTFWGTLTPRPDPSPLHNLLDACAAAGIGVGGDLLSFRLELQRLSLEEMLKEQCLELELLKKGGRI